MRNPNSDQREDFLHLKKEEKESDFWPWATSCRGTFQRVCVASAAWSPDNFALFPYEKIDLRRIQFIPEMFDMIQVRRWWIEKCDKIMELSDIDGIHC